MFADCFYLTEIEGIENLNTQNVTDMRDMFTCCYALTSLDVSNFNTQNVEDMTDMFLGCEKLSLLDLSNFNTERVESMSSMFSGCSTLQTIFASDKFFTNQVFDGDGMFQGCENLKGFIDYIPDSDRDNNEYANYKTGYFTKLVGKNGEKKIGATGETLATENLVLDDGKDFVACLSPLTRARKQNVSSIVSQVLTMKMNASPLRVAKRAKSLPALRCSSR